MDAAPRTLRELIWAAEARQRVEWGRAYRVAFHVCTAFAGAGPKPEEFIPPEVLGRPRKKALSPEEEERRREATGVMVEQMLVAWASQ